MTIDDEVIQEIIDDLDAYAREVDVNTYGLPWESKAQDRMHEIIREILGRVPEGRVASSEEGK